MEEKMKKKICIITIMVLSVVFAVSTYFYVSQKVQDKEQLNEFESIAQSVDDNEQCTNNKYLDLYAQNNDFVGWIKIDGTSIDYPVMQSKDNPNFYLNHNFNKKYSRFGVPYMQENCFSTSDNIIIYGHNMKNKSMFNELTKYADYDFYKTHKYINFNTFEREDTYIIIAAFKTVAYSDNGFRYYDFVNADNETEFDAYISKCKNLSLYNTNISAEYGDKLITLSTCEYSKENGRMVVVAKRV
jgi:sortase B